MRKAKSSRPTREEILAGIGYEPLEPMAGVPEEVRAAEDRELQDYLVTWVQGMSEHIASYDEGIPVTSCWQETAAGPTLTPAIPDIVELPD